MCACVGRICVFLAFASTRLLVNASHLNARNNFAALLCTNRSALSLSLSQALLLSLSLSLSLPPSLSISLSNIYIATLTLSIYIYIYIDLDSKQDKEHVTEETMHRLKSLAQMDSVGFLNLWK